MGCGSFIVLVFLKDCSVVDSIVFAIPNRSTMLTTRHQCKPTRLLAHRPNSQKGQAELLRQFLHHFLLEMMRIIVGCSITIRSQPQYNVATGRDNIGFQFLAGPKGIEGHTHGPARNSQDGQRQFRTIGQNHGNAGLGIGRVVHDQFHYTRQLQLMSHIATKVVNLGVRHGTNVGVIDNFAALQSISGGLFWNGREEIGKGWKNGIGNVPSNNAAVGLQKGCRGFHKWGTLGMLRWL
mmetsp:Transcript_10452/g.23097  ORF Transcript_10452/g.23097 Transcript_10452/m.23097 type:complete len:237 (-) Transcript_10452:107-817(-)